MKNIYLKKGNIICIINYMNLSNIKYNNNIYYNNIYYNNLEKNKKF